MLQNRILRLALALLFCWPTFSQEVPKIAEDAAKKAGDLVGRESEPDLGHALAEMEKSWVNTALSETPRNFLLQGAGTSTASSFQETVNQSFEKIRKSLNVQNVSPQADRTLILSELKAVNDRRWFWARQKLNLNGDVLQVQPAMTDSGDVSVSMPSLRDFYVNAMRKLSFANVTPRRTHPVQLPKQ